MRADISAPAYVLRLDTLSLFSIYFACHLFFRALATPTNLIFWSAGGHFSFASLATIVFALAALMRPWARAPLLGMAVVELAKYAAAAPVASNNSTLSAFTAFALMVSTVYVLVVDRRLDRERLLAAFAPIARDLLLMMYFFGIFHKINADFLIPDVSCAVAVYKPLASPFGLENWAFGQYAAIYGTFVIEAVAIVLLLSGRWKFWGFVIGVPFHLAIGFSGYAFYMDFSTICLALYSLFLPPQYFVRVNDALTRMASALHQKGSDWMLRAVIMALPLVVFVATFMAGRISGHFRPEQAMPAFALVGGLFYVSILVFCPVNNTYGETPSFKYLSPLLAILPLVFFINGFSPYFGFKTESSINMYSNLRTEGGKTNHFLFPKLPYIFSYQDHLVTVRSSSAPILQPYLAPNRQIVEYELDRILANSPGVKGQFVENGRTFDSVAPKDNVYLATNWLLRKFLIFKPVDWTNPKPCTH